MISLILRMRLELLEVAMSSVTQNLTSDFYFL